MWLRPELALPNKPYEIMAELPRIDEKNIDVKFANGVLKIKGEKQDEKEEKAIRTELLFYCGCIHTRSEMI
jgi:HSP20 family molecular chaperone IbpA